MPIPSIKEIFALIKTGATIEAQEKIMELREGAMELQEENLALRERVKLLEIEMSQKKNLKYENSLYWNGGDAVPFCPLCYENNGKLIHLYGPNKNASSDNIHWYTCHTCFNHFSREADAPYQAQPDEILRARATGND